MVSNAAREYLQEFPVYTLTAKDTKTAAAKLLLKDVQVMSSEIAGSSSGGICAFTVAWERPNQFSKVFSTIGSFTNIRGGNAYPDLVRKAPKKPIRVFQQDGANDLVNQFGSWPEANKAMSATLDEKGYDHKFVLGEGTHNPKHGASLLPDALRWLWRDYPH